MTSRRLPRSARGRALPRGSADALTWPPVLRGRSPLLVVLLLGWLGGGLLATAVALTTGVQADLAYGLTHVVSACLGLVLLVVAGPKDGTRRRLGTARAAGTGNVAATPAAEPVPSTAPVRVPVQQTSSDDQREPALH